MNKKSIAVLITCFNRREKTLKCLHNLFFQQGINADFSVKVFLVDDDSTDGTKEAIAQKFPEVKIIDGTGNLFWNRGMHLAWSEASKEKFDYYLWLNDDTSLYPSCFSEMLSCVREVNDQGIICGTTRSAINSVATYGGRNIKKELILPDGKIKPCDFFNGNCVLVSSYVFDIVGNLDYGFNHAIGDHDYGRRAAKKGIKSYISYGYIGECEKHESLPKWCSPSVKLKDRLKAFNTPLSVNPVEYFRYDYRHNGLVTAVMHYITIHLRLLFPALWQNKK